jgi:hypothetical protein
MKIFEALRKDHDKQRALVKLLLDTQGDSEERHFYAPLMQADSTIKMSRHGVAEHHQMDKLVAQIDSTDMSSPQWLNSFKQLAEKIEHHLAEEEQEFFQQAGKALSDEEKTKLAKEYQQEMNA